MWLMNSVAAELVTQLFLDTERICSDCVGQRGTFCDDQTGVNKVGEAHLSSPYFVRPALSCPSPGPIPAAGLDKDYNHNSLK